MTDRTPQLTNTAAARLVADTEPYLSCDDCFDRMDAYVEQLVRDPEYDDEAMRAHLRGCGACADEADALLELLRQP
jgi:hypothetical protein